MVVSDVMGEKLGDTEGTMRQFAEATREWFRSQFGTPTPAQEQAWETISSGTNALIIAPTGSGKTLAAFLWALDRLTENPAEGTSVLYISPLKALGVDVQKNLRVPLAGLKSVVTVGVRSGDTPPAQRRQLVKNPPNILITTPESLYLMLTSGAASTLKSVTTVIVDEVHALAGNKRGAHMALSLERLDNLLETPAQRIGLSATVRPASEVGRFLAGENPVRIVSPQSNKELDTAIDVPVKDMTNPESENSALGVGAEDGDEHRLGSVWPSIENSLYHRVMGAKSTIIFTNGRRLAERLTGALNEIHKRLDGVAEDLARAHHGSVSKEQRLQVEDDLKNGTLKCVVATASLELGIDMGEVDQIIQMDAPPSVASGLQRMGRAGHQVGAVSKGIFYPTHRSKLLETAAVALGIHERDIEPIKIPRSPLDILAQHTVAAAAQCPLNVEEWYKTVQRAAPFQTLPRSSFDAVLDMLAGKYPSTDFAELRPRIIWDRLSGQIEARPGAKQLAIMSGGTIPDRGLFRVEMGSEDGSSHKIGELDEEMVHETRVGEIFVLGTSSWRVREITPDRVKVVPAPGRAGKMPFWKGDSAQRPFLLGKKIGKLTAELAEMMPQLRKIGMDDNAISNTLEWTAAQMESTGVVPTDSAIVIERTKDQVGEWSILLESPFGLAVHAPWALAVAARLDAEYGKSAQTMASNDGIIVRFPDIEGEPPGAELFRFDPDEIAQIVTREVTGSALFAARFRECAARALLLGGSKPGKRSPLWQQRLKAGRLLEVASKYDEFPMIMEAARECLQDVYDMDALVDIAAQIRSGRILFHEVTTQSPSPFASNLLFGYVAEMVYQGDMPQSERRLAALSMDSGLMGQLLGTVAVRDLLEPGVAEKVQSELQRVASGYRVFGREGTADLLRNLGHLTIEEIHERVEGEPCLEELEKSQRIFQFSLGATNYYAAVEDAGTLAAGLGIEVPKPLVKTYPTQANPLAGLLVRYARTHAPFTLPQVAQRFGIQTATLRICLDTLVEDKKLLRGEFGEPGVTQWVEPNILKQMRRMSAALLRSSVKPVSSAKYAQFLTEWQGCIGHGEKRNVKTGRDFALTIVETLVGCPLAASTLETLILPARIHEYEPSHLEELVTSGEVIWIGEGDLGSAEGRISFHLPETLELTLPVREDRAWGGLEGEILAKLQEGGAQFGSRLAEGLTGDVGAALWKLAWAGEVTSDSLAALRYVVAGGRASQKTKPRTPRARVSRRTAFRAIAKANTFSDPRLAGRWSIAPRSHATQSEQASVSLSLMLDLYGVLSRGTVTARNFPGGFAAAYQVLADFEAAGYCRRGNFIEGLGGAQFAAAGTIDRLREAASEGIIALSAADPANPYGAAISWPIPQSDVRPRRAAGAIIVLAKGHPVFYLERGGKTACTWNLEDLDVKMNEVADTLVEVCKRGKLADFLIETIDGKRADASPWAQAFCEAGLSLTPSGLAYYRPIL